MRQILIIGMVIFLAGMPVSAQLSDDQQALLDDVRAAFERAESWQTYRQSIQETTTLTFTFSGEEDVWETTVTVRETFLEINREQGIMGSVYFDQTTLASDMLDGDEITRQADFIITDGTVTLVEDDSLTEITNELDEYADLGLPALAALDTEPTDTTILLDNVTAVYDLGVRERRGMSIQRYQLDLDFTGSLPALNLDLDALAERSENLISRDELFDYMADNGTLALLVAVNVDTGQLLSTNLILNLPLEIVVNDIDLFILEYTYDVITNYYDVGASIEIPQD